MTTLVKLFFISFIVSLTLLSCVQVAPQISNPDKVPENQAIVIGRLIGENTVKWMGNQRIMIYLHTYTKVSDIPTVYMGLSDHVRLDVKNDKGVFLASLPPGNYYISGFHYGSTHIEYTRNKMNPGLTKFATFRAIPGVINYIGSFHIGEYKTDSTNANFLTSETDIKNEFSFIKQFVQMEFPNYHGEIQSNMVILKN